MLPVDEAYAFDYLAILQIKNRHSLLDPEIYKSVQQSIQQQIGLALYEKIMQSSEYSDLLEANQKTFDSVDLARINKITAKDLDACNYGRYLAKKKLQEAFFSNQLFEVKKYKNE